MKDKKDKKDQFDDQAQQQALPIDTNFEVDEDFYLDEGEKDAVDYLLKVRNQVGNQNEVFKSNKFEEYSKMPDLQNTTGRDYLDQSLSRIYFQGTQDQTHNNYNLHETQNQNSIYQDKDLVFNPSKTDYKKQSFWDQNWLDQVLQQRLQMQKLIQDISKNLPKSELFREAEQYYDFTSKLSYEQINEKVIAKAGEVVLHSIFGIIVSEKEDEWDESEQISQKDQILIYGLLCTLEKPLLPDQAGDLNLLLNSLLKQKQGQGDKEKSVQAAQLDINIAIITEYFEQRFK